MSHETKATPGSSTHYKDSDLKTMQENVAEVSAKEFKNLQVENDNLFSMNEKNMEKDLSAEGEKVDDASNGEEGDEVSNGREGDELSNGEEGDEVSNDREGDEVSNGRDGDEISNGGESEEVSNGGESEEVSNGGESEEVSNGEESEEVSNGEESEEVSNGEESDEVSNGEEGDEVSNGEEGDEVSNGEGDEVSNGGEERNNVSNGGEERNNVSNGGEDRNNVFNGREDRNDVSYGKAEADVSNRKEGGDLSIGEHVGAVSVPSQLNINPQDNLPAPSIITGIENGHRDSKNKTVNVVSIATSNNQCNESISISNLASSNCGSRIIQPLAGGAVIADSNKTQENINNPTGDQTIDLQNLPPTVTLLPNADGSFIYLVGTAHFSQESHQDVIKTIEITKPNIIVLELCRARTAVLELDEQTILNESKSLNISKMRMVLRQHGRVRGILYLLFLSLSAHITKQLNMAPGGEFRVAMREARRYCPECVIHLGDRPIHVTLGRALASLSVWSKIKLMVYILFSKGPMTKDDVEKCKQKDFIEEVLAQMTDQFPGISKAFVEERDYYLTRSLQIATEKMFNPWQPRHVPAHRVIVGIVGMGHVAGITKLWKSGQKLDVKQIMMIPPPPRSDRIFLLTVKVIMFGLIGFGAYKCIPKSVKSLCQSSVDSTVTFIQTQWTHIPRI